MKYLTNIPGFIMSLLLLGTASASGQQYVIKSGSVSFSIVTPAGKLEAADSNITGYIHLKSGEVMIRCAINDFHFNTAFWPGSRNDVATNRFRKYYMQSEQYPHAIFKGKLEHPERISLVPNASYQIHAMGTATIHGVARKVSFDFTLLVKGNAIVLQAQQPVSIADYQIRVPPGPGRFFFEKADVQIDCSLQRR